MTEQSEQLDEIWNQEVALWESLKSEKLDSYLSFWHEDVMAWPFNQPVPVNKDDLHQTATDILTSLQSGSIEIRPQRMSVQVYDDVGFVHCKVDFTAVRKAGGDINLHHKITHTWLLTAKGWKIIGGMSADLPNI